MNRRKKPDNINIWWGMWWVLVVIFFAGLLCLLTGCGEKAEAGRFVKVSSQAFSSEKVKVFKDTETGIEYLFIDGIYKGGVVVMPDVDDTTFTGETGPMVFGSAATAVVAVAENATTTQSATENATVTEAVTALAGTGAAPESIGTYRVTAYCACKECCGKDESDPWYGITATGTRATEGRTIAVDPGVIPYGTTVYFEGPDGFGGYVAEDCGGAIKGKDIDLYFDSHAEALAWGVRELEVFAYAE